MSMDELRWAIFGWVFLGVLTLLAIAWAIAMVGIWWRNRRGGDSDAGVLGPLPDKPEDRDSRASIHGRNHLLEDPAKILIGTDQWTLQDFVQELVRTLQDWESGEVSNAEAHDTFSRLAKTVQYMAMTLNLGPQAGNRFKTQAAYDFFNLCGELASASSYPTAKPTLAQPALKIAGMYLGRMYGTRPWSEFVHRRGPTEAFGIVHCTRCGKDTPWAGTSGFLFWIGFSFCGTCGDLTEYNATDEELDRRLSVPLNQRNNVAGSVGGSGSEASGGGIVMPQCLCGGELAACSHGICAHCGAKGDDLVDRDCSAYEYFETHCMHRK